jgi:hypothetical protein
LSAKNLKCSVPYLPALDSVLARIIDDIEVLRMMKMSIWDVIEKLKANAPLFPSVQGQAYYALEITFHKLLVVWFGARRKPGDRDPILL